MVNKKIINIIAIILIITIVTACNTKKSTQDSDEKSSTANQSENQSVFTSTSDLSDTVFEEPSTYVEATYIEDNVQIISMKYVYKNNYIDYCIAYPQFENDTYGLNEQIKTFALETVEELGFETPYHNEQYDYYEERTIDEKYKLEYFDSNILSISFTGYYNVKGTAHPSYTARTINFDMNNGNKVNVLEHINIDEEFVKGLLNNVKAQLPSEIYEYLSDKSEDELISYCNNSNTMYFTQNGVGIYYEVPYALGGYANIHIPD